MILFKTGFLDNNGLLLLPGRLVVPAVLQPALHPRAPRHHAAARPRHLLGLRDILPDKVDTIPLGQLGRLGPQRDFESWIWRR